eukprot:701821-Pelagomonas_calceolata.AAC.6
MPDAWLGCLLWQGMQAPLLPEGPGAVAHAWEEGEAGLTRSQPPPWQPQSWSCLRRSSVPGLAAAAARSLGMRASVQRIAAAWRQCSPRPAPGLDAPARCGWQRPAWHWSGLNVGDEEHRGQFVAAHLVCHAHCQALQQQQQWVTSWQLLIMLALRAAAGDVAASWSRGKARLLPAVPQRDQRLAVERREGGTAAAVIGGADSRGSAEVGQGWVWKSRAMRSPPSSIAAAAAAVAAGIDD